MQQEGQNCWNRENIAEIVSKLKEYCKQEGIQTYEIEPHANKPELIDYIQSFVQNDPKRMETVHSIAHPDLCTQECS